MLGFEAHGIERSADGKIQWAWVQAPAYAPGHLPPAIMLEPSCLPVDSGAQGFFFYMHCKDVASLRGRLLAGGLRDGGAYVGHPGAERQPSSVFQMTHPPYMLDGEFRVHDPDGYAILVGQRM